MLGSEKEKEGKKKKGVNFPSKSKKIEKEEKKKYLSAVVV